MRPSSLFTFAIVLLTSLPACAQTRKSTSSRPSVPVILEATQKRTNPGRKEMSPTTTYRLQIVWKNQSAPTAFYIRPDATGWMAPVVAHPIKRPGLAPGDFMIVERNVDIKDIHYGDTLILTTRGHVHDADPIPTEVKNMPVKSLYYQTAAAPGRWIYTPLNFKKLPDMNMP